MKVLCTTLALACGHGLCAQVSESFSDSNFTDHPAWSGNTAAFNVQQGVLHSASAVAGSTYALSTPSALAIHTQWQWYINLQFNTSSTNYSDVFLVADSADLLKAKNGYFVRVGSSKDDICLYRLNKGKTTKIIDGTDGLLNKSNNAYLIKVIRDQYHRFFLFHSAVGATDWLLDGVVADSTVLTSSFFGIKIRQSTTSFFYKHAFDDIAVAPLVDDVTPPEPDTVIVQDNQSVIIQFNEQTDTTSALLNTHYRLNGTDVPVSVAQLSDRQFQLQFDKPFGSGVVNTLSVMQVSDIWGNRKDSAAITFVYYRLDTAQQNDIVITEIMADPDPPVTVLDYEYTELYNRSSKYLSLDGCTISDINTVSEPLTGIMAPGSYKVLSSKTVAGFPSLNNTGETIRLYNQNKQIIHSVTYTDKLYGNTLKQQGGWSLEMVDADNPCHTTDNWTASKDVNGGTPGFINSVHAINPDKDAPVILEAYAISDNVVQVLCSEPMDSIAAYHAMYNLSQNHKVYISNMSQDRTMIVLRIERSLHMDTTYMLTVSGLSDCSGNVMMSQTLVIALGIRAGQGDVVINELLFNPASGGVDFVELYNRSSKVVALKDLYLANTDAGGHADNWSKLVETGSVLFPGQYLLLSVSQDIVCKSYICANPLKYADMAVFPSMPDDEGTMMVLYNTGPAIDSVHYLDNWHFPLLGDKEGVSLERIDPDRPANDPTNWNSAASIVGYATPGYQNSQYRKAPQLQNKLLFLEHKTVSPDGDGYEDVLDIGYHLDKPGYTANIYIFNMDGILVKRLLNNETLLQDGTVSWNGTDDNQQKAAIGIYILFFEAFDTSGKVLHEKISCVLAGKL